MFGGSKVLDMSEILIYKGVLEYLGEKRAEKGIETSVCSGIHPQEGLAYSSTGNLSSPRDNAEFAVPCWYLSFPKD